MPALVHCHHDDTNSDDKSDGPLSLVYRPDFDDGRTDKSTDDDLPPLVYDIDPTLHFTYVNTTDPVYTLSSSSYDKETSEKEVYIVPPSPEARTWELIQAELGALQLLKHA